MSRIPSERGGGMEPRRGFGEGRSRSPPRRRRGGSRSKSPVRRRRPRSRSPPRYRGNRDRSPPPRGGGWERRRGRAEGGGGEMLSYKMFVMRKLDDRTSPAEADERYARYCEDWTRRNAHRVFEHHRHQEWFREKYDPTFLARQLTQRRAAAQKQAEALLTVADDEAALRSIAVAGAVESKEEGDDDAEDAEDGDEGDEKDAAEEEETPKAPRSRRQSSDRSLRARSVEDPTCLFIPAIPPALPRSVLQSTFEVQDGFDRLELSAPFAKGGSKEPYTRNAWVYFTTKEAAAEAQDKLQGSKVEVPALHPCKAVLAALSAPATASEAAEAAAAEGKKLADANPEDTKSGVAPEEYQAISDSFIHPLPALRSFDFTLNIKLRLVRPRKRLHFDAKQAAAVKRHLALATKLAKALDTEYRVAAGAEALLAKPAVEALSLGAKMNLVVEYLRRVHCYCFYSGVQAADEGGLVSACASGYELHDDDLVAEEEAAEPVLAAVEDAATARIADAERTAEAGEGKLPVEVKAEEVHARVEALLQGAQKHRLMDAFYHKFCIPASKEPNDERHRCGFEDNKLFKSRVYVIKHLHNKHTAEADRAYGKVIDSLRTVFELSLVEKIQQEAFTVETDRKLAARPPRSSPAHRAPRRPSIDSRAPPRGSFRDRGDAPRARGPPPAAPKVDYGREIISYDDI